MRILIISPASAKSTLGNGVTALRYAVLLRSLGHRVAIAREWQAQPADLLIALHARRSAASVQQFRLAHPGRGIVLVLTGTDVYRDIRTNKSAQKAMRTADRLVTLQPRALEELDRSLRRKARAIVQSARIWPLRSRTPEVAHSACVLGHLRVEKDPLRTALAVRMLARTIDLQVRQAGIALDERYLKRAQDAMDRDQRYRYLGSLSRRAATALLRRSDLMVLSSRMEGGANVLCEAIAADTPVIASSIAGNAGILGPNYPGYYAAGDTRALARLLERAATDPAFYGALRRECRRLRPLVRPARERTAWRRLLRELGA